MQTLQLCVQLRTEPGSNASHTHGCRFVLASICIGLCFQVYVFCGIFLFIFTNHKMEFFRSKKYLLEQKQNAVVIFGKCQKNRFFNGKQFSEFKFCAKIFREFFELFKAYPYKINFSASMIAHETPGTCKNDCNGCCPA